MQKKTSALHYIIPLLLGAAITFSGRTFTLGAIDASWARQVVIRLEDILIAFLLIYVVFRFLSAKGYSMRKPPLFPILILWIGFELVSSLTNALLGYLALSRVPFYTLKLLEYTFIFFYIFYFVKQPRDIKVLMTGWLVFIWIHLSYIFYQFLYPTKQGVWLIGEIGNFNIGGQFLILALFSLSYFIFYHMQRPISLPTKTLLGALHSVPIIGIFTPGIKAGAIAGIVGILLLFLLFIIKKQTFSAIKNIFILGVATLSLLIMLIFAARTLPYDFLYYRTLNLPSYETSFSFRLAIWQEHIQRVLANPLHTLIGRGGADPYAEASHNQYIRNFTAGGIVGSILFFLLIFSIMKHSLTTYLKSNNGLTVAFAAALFVTTIGMLIMGMSGEAFFIVRPAEHYWYFAALAFALFTIKNDKKST